MSSLTFAFDPPIDQRDEFAGEIHVSEKLEVSGDPVLATLEIRNESDLDGQAKVNLAGIDGWKVSLEPKVSEPIPSNAANVFMIKPGEDLALPFTIHPATDSLSALYPIHAYVDIQSGTRRLSLHPIAIVEAEGFTRRQDFKSESTPSIVSPEIPFLLVKEGVPTFEILPDSGQPLILDTGWTGMDSETGAVFQRGAPVHRYPKAKPAIGIHPPWRKGPGRAQVHWDLQLPEMRPVTFGASIALRSSNQGEPVSDGVTFRLYANEQKLLEKNSDSKSWEGIQVDLSAFAGKEVRLTLESDVGPKRDSTCDMSYWGQPWIYAGDLSSFRSDEEQISAIEDHMNIAKMLLDDFISSASLANTEPISISKEKGSVFLFGKERDRFGLSIVEGENGILDAGWAVGTPGAMVAFDGFQVHLEGSNPLDPLSGFKTVSREREGARFLTRIRRGPEPHWVAMDIEVREEGIRVDWDSDLRITHLSASRFDKRADDIYLGVGNVIRGPNAPFTLHADGHQLATRHIGLRFEPDLGLLIACSTPPDQFTANPDRCEYALHSHSDGSFYFVPVKGRPFEALPRYKRMVQFSKAAGVDRLAGLFTFDLWGGAYKDIAAKLDLAAKYGLTHSVVVFHAWQRWGYDYRLPDIFPPNPRSGTLEEFQNLREVCRRHGVFFAPHDNYIDFYPDAEGYSYDRICFDSTGNPIKGWLNPSRGAQAYRFRPDKFLPFLERNLNLVEKSFHPDAYFVDVFSSIGAFDY